MKARLELKNEVSILTTEINLLKQLLDSPQIYSDSKHYLFTLHSIKEGKRLDLLNTLKELNK